MTRLLSLLLLSAISLQAAPKLKIHQVHQKVNEVTGQKYGAPPGIYFTFHDLDFKSMYAIEYSHDLKIWTHLYVIGTFSKDTVNFTSSKFEWNYLPPEKCFFRLKKLW